MMELKKNFRKITSLVVALAIMVTAVVFDVPKMVVAEAALSTSAEGGCDGDHTSMTAWAGEAFAASGKYYLTGDVDLTSQIEIGGGVDVTLCLSGHTITAKTTEESKFRILHIKGGSLTLCDCQGGGKLTGGNTDNNYHGGAVHLESGSFNMHGGKISGNKSITANNSGGGVYVESGTFTMTGGEISDNMAHYNGGGVILGGSSKFIMTGGKIINNQTTLSNAYGGGGVCVNGSSATFKMSGGEISGNNAGCYGGGIYFTGGTITLDGKVKITGNTKGDGTETNNIYLGSNKTITIGSGFSTDSSIGMHCSTSPTCTNFKNTTGVCTEDISRCFTADNDDEAIIWNAESGKVQLMKKHIFSDTPTTTDPTCTESGRETGGCSVCNDPNAFNPIPATGHNYGDWNTTAATCTAEGKKERSCSKCNTKETEIIDKIAHNYVSGKCDVCNAVDPDHTHTGGTATCEKRAVCTICEQEYGVLAEHSYGEWKTVTAATCTADGTRERSCTYGCGTKETDTISATGHTYENGKCSVCSEVDPDHTHKGGSATCSEKAVCTICGEGYGELAEHSYGAWTITKNPTETATGTVERTCSFGEKDTKTDVPALSDSTVWTKDEAQHADPTEDEDGKDVYTSVYGTVTVTLPSKKHTHVWGDWSITKNPTETATGTAERNCSCGEKDTKTDVPALSDSTVWTKTQHVDPTEELDGKDVYKSVYGTVEVTLDPTGHTLTHVPEVPATETTEGTKEHWHCAGCNKDCADENGATELTDLAIPPLTHTHTLTHVPEVPATETTEGTKEHWHCAGCNKDFADENGEKEITSDELKIGRIEKEVQSGENAPTAELTTPKEELIDAVLTSEEQAVVNDGKDVKIILTIENATESVSSEDKTAVESRIESLTNYHLGQYLDVNLLKIIGGETEKIAETSAPITITFEIPVGLRVSGRSYSVIRVHDGETTVLPDLDSDENTVTIRTDKFSTYALAYLENAAASDPSGGNSGGNPSTPAIPTPGGNHSGSTPSGNGSSSTGGNSSNNGNSGSTSGNGNSTANENGNDSSNDRNDDDSSDIEEDPSDDEDDFSDDDDDSADVDDDFSDDDDESTDVEEDSSVGESGSANGNSDQAVNASSEDTAFSVDGTGHGSVESDSNPSTGVTVSLVPLAAAMAVLMAAGKRKKK